MGVVFNASNNELVRTNTLVKGAIIQVDATPFRVGYEKHYGKPVTTKRRAAADEVAPVKRSGHVEKKFAARQKDATLDQLVEQQFGSGRLYACISEFIIEKSAQCAWTDLIVLLVGSRPGQSGRCDGYILEGAELEHYVRRLRSRSSKHG